MASNFSVELFKVPFDNSYKKVFDIDKKTLVYSYNCEKTFHDNVLSRYDNKTVSQPSVSNIKRYNNRIIFTIRENYFNCRDYNYISLNYEDKYYFYFITDIVSENDNPVNPATTITAEWDVWHNHLTDLYFHKVDNKNTIIRAHENRFDEDLHTTFYRNNDSKTYIEKTINYDNNEIVYNDSYKMLWLKVTVSDEFFTQYNNKLKGTFYLGDTGTLTNCTGIRPITNSNFRNVIYIPISIYYNGESVGGVLRQKKITDTSITQTGYVTGSYIYDSGTGSTTKVYYDINGRTSVLYKLPDVNNGLNILELYNENGITSYYKSVEFTFNAPYRIEFSKTGELYYADIYTPFVRYYNIFSKASSYFGTAIIGMPDKLTGDLVNYEFYQIPTSFTIDDTEFNQDFTKMKDLFFEYEINKDIFILPSIIPNTNIDNNDSIEQEPKLFIYPYKYYSLYYNNSEYILDLPQEKSQYLEYKLYINKKTSQPYIKIMVNRQNSETFFNQLNNGNIFLKNSGEITYAVDALADYQIRNGAQEKTSVYINMLNNIIKNGFNKSGISGAISSGVTDLAKIASKYVDLNNTTDNVILSNRGEDDIEIQDSVLIYTNICSDEMIIKEKYNEFYIYGYDFVKIDDIINNSRFWFDYKQTQNCKLNNCINANDKQRIEQMFNDGVHMFHINYDINTEQIIVNSSMEFNGKNNIERSIATI